MRHMHLGLTIHLSRGYREAGESSLSLSVRLIRKEDYRKKEPSPKLQSLGYPQVDGRIKYLGQKAKSLTKKTDKLLSGTSKCNLP